MIKNILFIVVSVFLASCDDIPNGVVEQLNPVVEIQNLFVPSSINYTGADTKLQVRLTFSETQNIERTWFKITSIIDGREITDAVELKNNGNQAESGDITAEDNIFSGYYLLSEQMPNGDYSVEIYLKLSGQNTRKIAVSKFYYDNGQDNFPPELSDLNIPASVNRGEQFVFTVKAKDANGLADIKYVYFVLTRPDGTTVIDTRTNSSKFIMDDTGNLDIYGDQTAGDGVYSFKNSFGETAQTGSWVFKFEAEDRSGKLSNQITHTMTIL